MFRKAFAAFAALMLAAQPALAKDPPRSDGNGHVITRQTLLPIGIVVGLLALVVAFTLHTRNNGKKPASP